MGYVITEIYWHTGLKSQSPVAVTPYCCANRNRNAMLAHFCMCPGAFCPILDNSASDRGGQTVRNGLTRGTRERCTRHTSKCRFVPSSSRSRYCQGLAYDKLISHFHPFYAFASCSHRFTTPWKRCLRYLECEKKKIKSIELYSRPS